MIKLRRIVNEPILEPIAENPWEAAAVFNCGMIYDNGLFHMLYRATDRDFEALGREEPEETLKFTSSFGYAVSTDGVNFNRLRQPILVGEGSQERWGVEDPRISKIDDTYYLLYTGFGGVDWSNHRICMARSKNLIEWEKMGVVLDEPNKDAALLENRVDGRYMLFHRRMPNIWVAFSRDLKNWEDHQIIMRTIPNTWESFKIGLASQPLEIDDGYLMLYHAVDEQKVYRLGAALLDKKDPTKVIARQKEPILEPELDWEVNGFVPNVVFSNGHAVKGNELFVYYGGADRVIGVAKIGLDEIKF